MSFKAKMESTFGIPRNLLTLVDCFPESNRQFNLIAMRLVVLLLAYSSMTTIYSMYYDWPDYPEVAVNASPCMASTSALIIFINYVVFRDEFRFLLEVIREDFWVKYESAPAEEREIIMRYGHSAQKYILFHAVTMFSAGPLWLVKPLLEMYLLSPKDASKPVGRIIPFKNWLPFHLDMYADPIYQILYVMQGFGSFFTISMMTSINSFFVFFVLNTCAQFKVLQTKIINFDRIHSTSAAQEEYLHKIIELHQKLCQFCEVLEVCLTNNIMMQFINVCLFMCTCGFIITVFPGNNYIYIQNAICLIASLDQLYLYCFPANDLTTEALAVADAAYLSNWYNASPNIKKLILLIMMRSQKPQYLTAGKLVPASVATFESVIRTAVSYFTVLRSVMEEGD